MIKTNTKLMITFFIGIIAMLVFAGGLHLVRLECTDTILTLCGWYMLADGLLTLIGAMVYSFTRQFDCIEHEDEERDYDEFV